MSPRIIRQHSDFSFSPRLQLFRQTCPAQSAVPRSVNAYENNAVPSSLLVWVEWGGSRRGEVNAELGGAGREGGGRGGGGEGEGLVDAREGNVDFEGGREVTSSGKGRVVGAGRDATAGSSARGAFSELPLVQSGTSTHFVAAPSSGNESNASSSSSSSSPSSSEWSGAMAGR
jgi:hypothetical protein